MPACADSAGGFGHSGEAAGLTQVQVAEKAALDEKHYQTVESGLSKRHLRYPSGALESTRRHHDGALRRRVSFFSSLAGFVSRPEVLEGDRYPRR